MLDVKGVDFDDNGLGVNQRGGRSVCTSRGEFLGLRTWVLEKTTWNLFLVDTIPRLFFMNTAPTRNVSPGFSK